jgi:hypothetical protein
VQAASFSFPTRLVLFVKFPQGKVDEATGEVGHGREKGRGVPEKLSRKSEKGQRPQRNKAASWKYREAESQKKGGNARIPNKAEAIKIRSEGKILPMAHNRHSPAKK